MEFIYVEGTLEKGFNKCRELLSQGKRDEVRDICDYLIAILGTMQYEGEIKNENEKVDGVSVKVWKRRFWIEILENEGLLLA